MSGGALEGTFNMESGTLDYGISGGESVSIRPTASGVEIESSDASAKLTVSAPAIFSNLPLTDPGVAGQLWSDSGTVKVSAG